MSDEAVAQSERTWVASGVWRDTPAASSPEARRRMQATKGRDSRPEVRLRKILHARGLRFRVHTLVLPDLRRRADVVFPGARVAVYVDGCFWHGCTEHVVWPRTNVGWWKKKIAATQRRDRDTDRRLSEAGWRVVRIWEHDDPVVVADVVEAEVRAARERVRTTARLQTPRRARHPELSPQRSGGLAETPEESTTRASAATFLRR